MAKVTKARILKDLKTMKEDRVTKLKREGRDKLTEARKGFIAEHKDLINEAVKEFNSFLTKYDKLTEALYKDVNIQMYRYSNHTSGLLSHCTSYENVENFVLINSAFYRGKSDILANAIEKEVKQLESEWDKLILNVSRMNLKEILVYLTENKIELPCLAEQPEEEKGLTVIDVNLNLLFGGER